MHAVMHTAVTEVLTTLRPAQPVTYGNLTVLPIVSTNPSGPDYELLDRAVHTGQLIVREVDEVGEVPFLKAVNHGPAPVLLHDGEELVGAKQNRILNVTALLGVGETVLPVSCIEAGRWNARSRTFAAGVGTAHPALRRIKERQVRRSLERRPAEPAGEESGSGRAAAYGSDQGRVWDEVAECSARLKVRSSTSDMTDVYESRSADLEDVVRAMEAPITTANPPDPLGAAAEGSTRACGDRNLVAAAAFIDGRFACLDSLWPSGAFARLYPKLLRGYAVQALDRREREAERSAAGGGSDDPEAYALRLFAELDRADGRTRHGVDLGEDLRLESQSASASGLLWEGRLVQLSVFPFA